MSAVNTTDDVPPAPETLTGGNPPPENPVPPPALDPLTLYMLLHSPIEREITVDETDVKIFTVNEAKWTEKTGGKHSFSPWSFFELNC